MCENCNNTEFPTSTVTGPKGDKGDKGDTGNTGGQGADGDQGLFGGNSIEFKWLNGYSGGDPGPGYVTNGSLDPSVSSQLFLSWFDVNNTNVATWLTAIYSFTLNTSNLAFLRVFHKSDSTKYMIFGIGTGGYSSAGWETLTALPVVCSSGSSVIPFITDDPVVVTFSLTGEKGDTGLTGPQGPQSIAAQNIVYVTKDGDDSTGMVNRQDRPFATFGSHPATGITTGAIPAIMAYTTPSSVNPFLIKVGPGVYNHPYTISLPDWVDIDMGSATLNSNLTTATLQFRGRSNIYGGGAAISNSNVAGTHIAIDTNGFAGGRLKINTIRGTVDLNLGGATMYIEVDVITPDQGAYSNGFTNFTMRNGSFTFKSSDCYSGIQIGATSVSTNVKIHNSLLRNGIGMTQGTSGTTDAKCFNSIISRPNNTNNVNSTGATVSPVQNAVIYMTGDSIWEGHSNRIESLEEDFSGFLSSTNTTVIKNQATAIALHASVIGAAYSIKNGTASAWNVYDYGGNAYSKIEGGAGAITYLVDIPNIDVNVI